MSSDHGASPPRQPNAAPALLHRLSAAPIEEDDFEEQIVEICEAIVAAFRKGEITKGDASFEIFKALDLDGQSEDVDEYAQRKEALSTYLELLDSTQHELEVPDRFEHEVEIPTREPSEERQSTRRLEYRLGHSKRKAMEVDDPTDSSDLATPRKRKPVDESLFPFLHDSGSTLCPELQRTLLFKENYTRDLPLCRQAIMSRPNAPGLPSNIWTSILSNEYVDLNKVLGALYSTGGDTKQAQQFGEFEIITDNVKTTRTITSHGHWAIAWTKYCAGVTFAYPHRDSELKAYGEHITNAFSAVDEISHRRVIEYDKAIRTDVGRLNNVLLTDFGRFNHIYTMHINSSGAGSSASSSRTEGRSKLTTSDTSSRSLSNEICKRFNSGNCRDARSCNSSAPLRPMTSTGSFERPRRFRGFLWCQEETAVTPSATASETLRPIPGPPPAALNDAAAWNTINSHPHLFPIKTPIDVDRFETLLISHPNRPLVESMIHGLRYGFWPFAHHVPEAPDIWDEPNYTIDDDARSFISHYAAEEQAAGRYSPPFTFDLQPGMYSMPIHAVPKPHSNKLRLINNHSAGPFALNSFIDKSDVGMRPDNVQDLGRNLLTLRQDSGNVPVWLFKSDVSGAYRLIPMHPLWQLKQVITINGERRIDHCMCFGSRGSADIWCSFMSLVLWIAIHVKLIALLLAYMDDAFSFDTNMALVHYPRYNTLLPSKQVRLLLLWDELGIPHDLSKQLFGRALTIIGYHIDSISMTISLPSDSSLALVTAIRDFIDGADSLRRQPLRKWQRLIGWINWGLNVQPLLRPALQSCYSKIKGKTHPHAGISLNRSVRRDLEWVASVFQRHTGVHVLRSRVWHPSEADLTIYCDASLSGMGFWSPQRDCGFCCDCPPIPDDVPAECIFWFEALTVLAALEWAATLQPRPLRLAIFSDNMNTVQIFDSFRAISGYNNILISACNILIDSDIDLRSSDFLIHTPSRHAGGLTLMISISSSSRQPRREPWSMERLVHARAVALGHALDRSTQLSYSSHLQSYLTFCKLHDFAIEPTADTLSFYTVFMCHHIKPDSVDSYLSGICNQLEHLFPTVRSIRKGALVTRTLAGCRRLFNTPTSRKQPLAIDDCFRLLTAFPPSSHDNILFRALLVSGFFALHRLGELVWPDKVELRSWRKVIKRSSVKLYPTAFGYVLPTNKSDPVYASATIIIEQLPQLSVNPLPCFQQYLSSRDKRFRFHPALWVTSQGTIPTRAWFLSRLRKIFPPSSNIGGHSLRSGGATHFAIIGWPDDRIQALGRWSSDAFKIYIRKNPVVLQALLNNRRIELLPLTHDLDA
ncbi:hypothetical protein EUX98_g9370 [Antrodiella citrinella]|uniref:Reverse transcriptase domain-containing protein n=1 Tax=Antrodiella citrinella TaxID=2447956 RepID=A0A4S4LU76_9APHY|nr:hypothetical protein EUX98_g9370 [Antrodiella citrinella]